MKKLHIPELIQASATELTGAVATVGNALLVLLLLCNNNEFHITGLGFAKHSEESVKEHHRLIFFYVWNTS